MAKMSGGRFIAETLHAYGITHYFFMPVSIPEALPDMERLGIAPVMAHSEKAAAYMADGYARVARRVGVCGAQSVGALNLAAGLQDAYLACAPVMALTGRVVQNQMHRNAYQEVDHLPSFSTVTKFSTQVTDVAELPLAMRHAFREATTGMPRPVHLDLWGVWGEHVTLGEADMEIVVEQPFTRVPAFRPEADGDAIEAALRELMKAERPVIVAGGGVTVSQAGPELVALAECLNIPIVTALSAKETVPFDHPLAVGAPGTYSRACANQTLAEADVVFFVGSRTGGQVTNQWQLPRPGTTIVQLDIEAAEIGRTFPVTVGLHGDAKASLARMLAAAGDVSPGAARDAWVARTQAFVKAWREEVALLANADTLPMRPERLCTELTAALPADAILVSDTGHAGIWTGTMMDLTKPGQSYIRCAGSLGWGIPAAIGAKCAAPERPVVCFTGDGGAYYHFAEFETAARHGIPTITVINNNASLNQEQSLNEIIFKGRTTASDAAWIMSDINFAAIAEAMGCLGITVTKPAEIDSAMDQALSSGRPAIIDVKTDIAGIAPAVWN